MTTVAWNRFCTRTSHSLAHKVYDMNIMFILYIILNMPCHIIMKLCMYVGISVCICTYVMQCNVM